MKAGLLVLSALFAGALAQPHGRHAHQHRQLHKHHKRDYVTVTQVVTATDAEVVVFMDEHGSVLYSTLMAVTPTASPTPSDFDANGIIAAEVISSTTSSTTSSSSSSSSSSSTPPPPPPSSTYTPPPAPPSSTPAAPAPAPAQSSAAPAPSPAAPAPVSNGDYPIGLSYAPYLVGGCKTAAQVMADFQAMAGYDIVRIYGVDCDQVANAVAAAQATGKKLFLGIYDLTQVSAAVQTIAAAVHDWSIVDIISVGNEDVNRGTAVGTVVAAVNSARAQLRAAGYTGPVTHVDTFDQLIAHPELCAASDLATANCHAFFTSSISAAGAGAYVLEQAHAVGKACPGKKVVITESGWPSQGDANGAAVPSIANQALALASLRAAFPSDLILFSAFNDKWKTNYAGSFGAEQFWGILD